MNTVLIKVRFFKRRNAMTAKRKVLTMLTVVLPALVLMFFAAPASVFAEGDGDTVTRAEWMSALEMAFELEEDNIVLPSDTYFSDLDETSEYYDDFILALRYGLINVEEGAAVRPDDPATREFAATTTNFFLGLKYEGEYTFLDSEGMSDPVSAQIAVNENWLTLMEGDLFSPTEPITVAEKNNMLTTATLKWMSSYSFTEVEETDAAVTGFTGEGTTLYLPRTWEGRTVSSVNANAFKDKTQIKTAIIPDSITAMGASAFGNCKNITKVIIPVDFKYTYDSAPFYGCTGVTEIYYTKGQTGIMRDVSTVNSDTANYYRDRLEYSTKDSLEKVSFEEGITRIGNDAYYNPYNSSNTYPCKKLETVILPASLTEIGSNAFRSCTSLNDITLPEGLEELGGGCFWGCTSLCKSASPDETMTLEDIGMPASLETIPANCFKGCTGIEGTLTIPDQITELGASAFGNCTNITKVIIPVDFKYTYDSAPFYGCTGVTEIYYTKGQTGIMRDVSTVNSDTANYYSARIEYSTKDSLEKVSFEEGITRIGNDAYYNPYNSSNTYPCTKLETVILPASLEEIGSNAFRSCTSLNDITLPEGLEELGGGCFWDAPHYVRALRQMRQ